MNARQLAAMSADLPLNVVSIYEQSTVAERQAGADWYPRATAQALDWAGRERVDVRTVASVIAALSPQCEWTRNLIAADEVLLGCHVIGHGPLPRNIEIARRIFSDRALSTVSYFKDAPKVHNFEHNVAGDYRGHVTIDAHAAEAALQRADIQLSVKPTTYPLFAAAYHTAANIVGLDVATLQAIVWVTWKRLHNPAAKRAARKGHHD